MLFLLNLHLVYGTESCTTYVCFNWKVTFHELKLTCKVNKLHFKVWILDQYGNVQGSCIPPTPSSKCEPFYGNGTLSQNSETNETIFIVHGKIDYRINGNWTCLHGRQRDVAQVEVTVLRMKEMRNITKSTKNRYNNQSCKPIDQEYSCMTSVLLTTTLSIIGSIILSILYLSFVKTSFKRIDDFFKKLAGCICICTNRHISEKVLVCKRITFALSTILLLVLAVPFGLFNDKNCNLKWAVIGYGLVFEFIISLLLLSKVDPSVNDKPGKFDGEDMKSLRENREANQVL